MKKTEIKMNKPILILEIRKIVIYRYWYDYVKPKYGDKMLHRHRQLMTATDSLCKIWRSLCWLVGDVEESFDT